jgi:hypothetical protein
MAISQHTVSKRQRQLFLSWQPAPVNGTQRFTRSIVAGIRVSTAVVSHDNKLGWLFRVYTTDNGSMFEERLFHAAYEATPSRRSCMRQATEWLRVASGLSS